jgi:TetR/AcrR family transcriptional regulator, cholesterol catabolism regulator
MAITISHSFDWRVCGLESVKLETMLSDRKQRYQEVTANQVLDVVIEVLRSEGYDAVQLREVARRAQVGLGTLYKLFPSREALIVSAVSKWMAANAFATSDPPQPGESLRDVIVRQLRQVFEPWQREPRMLQAFHQARFGPAGEHLNRQGFDAVVPIVESMLADYAPDYVDDLRLILINLVYGVLSRVAHGELDPADMLSILERAVARLTDTPAGANADNKQPPTPSDA